MHMDLVPDMSYGQREHILREIYFARSLFAAHPRWTVVDITGKAIEETAADILRAFSASQGRQAHSPLPPTLTSRNADESHSRSPVHPGFALVIACVAAIGFRTLRQAQDRRFAVSLRAEPAANAPMSCRWAAHSWCASKSTPRAARNRGAWAFLLDGSGGLLADLQPLVPRTLENGKTVEETIFPADQPPLGARSPRSSCACPGSKSR